MSYSDTPEQSAVIDWQGTRLVVGAFAGTGKTTTLRRFAEQNPDERMLYVAYNRAIRDEAEQKFPYNVTCRTSHQLAFAATGKYFTTRNAGMVLGSALDGAAVAGAGNTVVPVPASVPEEPADQTIGNVMALMGFSTQPEPAGPDISVPGNTESAVAERAAESGADLQGKTEKHENCGELFWQWLRNGVRAGSISVNSPDSLAHITGGMLFIPTPEIFFAFLKDFPEIIPGTSRDDIQREFEKLGRNFCRRDNALFQCQKYEEENRQGRYKRWAGYLIKARQIYTGEEVPCDSVYLFVSKV